MTKKLKYSLPEFDGFSFPNQDLVNFGLDHSLQDSPGLLMHIFLSRILLIQLSKKIPENADFDLDTCLSLSTVYHSSRQEADYGKENISKKMGVNKFMSENNSDMDYALQELKKYGFGNDITNGINNFILNPFTRESYFPNETLEKDGKLNLTQSISMLSSWLIAGPITNIENRFNDLKNRRSGEIGKLELDNIKNKINSGVIISIPKPIIDIAIKDLNFSIKSQDDLLDLIKTGEVTNEIIGKWILLGYEDFANKIVFEYCKLCGIDDFYGFIKESLDLVKDENKKEIIKLEFEKYLGRSLKEYEIIPYIPGIELVFKRLSFLRVEEFKEKYKIRIVKILQNLERVTESLKK